MSDGKKTGTGRPPLRFVEGEMARILMRECSSEDILDVFSKSVTVSDGTGWIRLEAAENLAVGQIDIARRKALDSVRNKINRSSYSSDARVVLVEELVRETYAKHLGVAWLEDTNMFGSAATYAIQATVLGANNSNGSVGEPRSLLG